MRTAENFNHALVALERAIAADDDGLKAYKAALSNVLQEVRLRRTEASVAQEKIARLEAKAARLEKRLTENFQRAT